MPIVVSLSWSKALALLLAIVAHLLRHSTPLWYTIFAFAAGIIVADVYWTYTADKFNSEVSVRRRRSVQSLS